MSEGRVVGRVLLSAFLAGGCSGARSDVKGRMTPEYDKTTGKLTLLKYDSDGDGKIDMWSYMDGSRVVRVEIDKNEDGQIDRWEYYDANQKLEKIGSSRAQNGKEDAWSYLAADGSIERIEVSTRQNGKITRIEHYKKGVLVSVEEDGDGDGKMDKWETYEGNRLASVAFDTVHRGKPDRRLIYGVDGSARLEIDQKGTGEFTPVNPK